MMLTMMMTMMSRMMMDGVDNTEDDGADDENDDDAEDDNDDDDRVVNLSHSFDGEAERVDGDLTVNFIHPPVLAGVEEEVVEEEKVVCFRGVSAHTH